MHQLLQIVVNLKDMDLYYLEEKKIMIEYYGLFGEESKTHDQLAKELGLTRERIRQCRAEALKKLRASSKIEALRDYL